MRTEAVLYILVYNNDDSGNIHNVHYLCYFYDLSERYNIVLLSSKASTDGSSRFIHINFTSYNLRLSKMYNAFPEKLGDDILSPQANGKIRRLGKRSKFNCLTNQEMKL